MPCVLLDSKSIRNDWAWPLLINMTVTVWHVLHPDPEALHLFSHINRGWPFSRVFKASYLFWVGCGFCVRWTHWTTFSWDPSRNTVIMESANIDGSFDASYSHLPRLGQNFRLVWKVYFWPPDNIDVFWWKSSVESDLRLRHRPLSNRWCIFQLFSCWGKSVPMCCWRSWPMSLPSY